LEPCSSGQPGNHTTEGHNNALTSRSRARHSQNHGQCAKNHAGIFGVVARKKNRKEKRVALPALQSAMRNDLTLDDRDNGAAAATLARLHCTMKVGEVDDSDWLAGGDAHIGDNDNDEAAEQHEEAQRMAVDSFFELALAADDTAVDAWDFEEQPEPLIDTRLDIGLNEKRLKAVKPDIFA
jgi:hypothetical protein